LRFMSLSASADFFFQAVDGIRHRNVTGVQTCALPISGDPAAMDAVGKMLDEAEKLAEKAKAAIKAALADEDSRYHSVVTFFMEFHRDDVGPDIAAELFPGTDPSKLSFSEMVDFLKLKRFGSLVDDEMDQQVFILDLSFNPEITDELMVIYFDLNKEIFCITHES